MKKISARTFCSVVWSGVCQAFGWFFGLFGYKRDGKTAKCVWGVFATSAAIIMAIIALNFVYETGERAYGWYKRNYCGCEDPDCDLRWFVYGDIYFHNHYDGKGYIYNKRTGKKFAKHVDWIAEPEGIDSLVCYSDGEKRGYFSKYTGKVVIEPRFDHAWLFSEGLASVDDGGIIKFIDPTGKVVIDTKIPYIPDQDSYMFHDGFCIIYDSNSEKYGLLDKTGKFVLPVEYDDISQNDDKNRWTVEKGKEMAVYDNDMNPIIPFMEGDIYVGEGTIDIAMPDHTMRKYDLQGQLIDDFYINSFRMLEYEKETIVYLNDVECEDDEYYSDEEEDYYHPKATARLRAYVAGGGFEGLMTADGHIVTMPLYEDIDAIGYDLYLCEVSNCDQVIINGRGEIVR